ncbi:flagellar hook-basal body complex protein [Tropicimonas sp.]|uniref:flagellar hook-basal body complex protein n=1 Tax=Tropicimonas sp. TaxID=2067044 RepID=UPI003A8BFBA2
MSSGYVTLSRQVGLFAEMGTIANNIANMSTAGFRREGVVFTEYVTRGAPGGESVSMAAAHARRIDLSQGTLDRTGGAFDLAIEGDGFFMVSTPNGERLTRAGVFQPNDAGDLVTADGYFVLDEGGAPIFVPPDAGAVTVAPDGTISAGGRPLARLALVRPVDGADLEREGSALIATQDGLEPVPDSKILQGFVEASNVNPVAEITRMIEVQRAYELGQALAEREGERLTNVIKTLGR